MKTRVYLTLLLMLVIGGCVPSLHQLWTKETLVYDDAIKGKYQESDNVWKFAGDPQQKSYALTIHEKDDKVSQLTAHLVEVQGQRFLDMYPSDDAELEGGDWLKFHLVPAHLFLHVSATEPNLVVAAMDPDEVRKLLEQQPELVRHEIIEDNRVVLTDSPEHLQKFLLAGLKIEGFFGEPSELKPVQDDTAVTP
jgi:hypothetical protein